MAFKDAVSSDLANKFTYNLTQDYLEVARAALTPIHGKVPTGAEKPPPSDELLNAVFAVVSISIVYSFLALESFLNSQLFRIWEQRHEPTDMARKFSAMFSDPSEFVKLKNHEKFRELPDRLRTLCELLGYPQPHAAIPDTWRRLHELSEASRHFVVHPYPDREFFQRNMSRILQDTETGAYVRVVEEVLTFLYAQSGKQPPAWIKSNQLIEFRGVNLLPTQGG